MKALTHYQIHSTLHEGVETTVYRGQTPTHQQPTILKLLKAEYPTLEAITRLKHEYQTRQNLEHPNIVKVLSIETFNNRLGLLLEDFGGDSLAQLLQTEKLTVTTYLNIAIQIVKALDYLHQNQIIHKDIKPSNIIINVQTKIVKITDFGIASRLSKENPLFNNPNSFEGTLVYMSPEQTGRMNRVLDYRTDFYSLGVTLYEMFAGQLPFQSDEPLELVYSHIAKPPTPLQQLNSKIPPAISEIVMKLMAKNAEDRYQSAAGLLADLEICLNQLTTTGEITDFIPGHVDILSQLLIPQKLYGRETQVNLLLAAFERVAVGLADDLSAKPATSQQNPSVLRQCELMLVSGYSGIGKSAVVHEVNKPITRQRGYFISGKFDQFKRNIPYVAVIDAFGSLIRQVLTENSTQLEGWRSKILTALGSNGQVIIDVIPEVELIIGKQPEVPQLGSTESQNRFNRVFKEFIRVFTQKEHPLVVFLDDLQWADSATLKLMKLLVTDPDSRYLLLIGAYRDNEVSPTHPLIQTLDEIQKTGTIVNNIVLQPLDLANVTELMADTLNETERVKPLAELIWNKTGGNPFFLTQVLQALYQENLLKFDFNSLANGGWQWSLGEIQAIGITDKSVVELVAERIQKLPEKTVSVLKLAACIGDRFSLDVLSIVNEQTPGVTASELYSALQRGLILPLSEAYKIPLVFDEKEVNTGEIIKRKIPNLKSQVSGVSYKFLHDRVQQAAYSLIPESYKKETHLKIGQLLLQAIPESEIEDNIFEIVNQLNIGIEFITEQAEFTEKVCRKKIKLINPSRLAQLNLTAGRKAKAAAAYEVAVKYLNVGLILLSIDTWIEQYDLTLSLYVEAMEAEYLNTNFERAKALSEVCLKHAKNILDKVKVYEIQMQFHIQQHQMQAALDIGLQVLNMLDVSLVAKKPRELTVQELDTLPQMTDPTQLATMRILMNLCAPTYVLNPALNKRVAFTMVDLCIQQGRSALAAFGYGLYDLIMCGLRDIDAGYRAGQLALRLLVQFDAKELKAKIYGLFYAHASIWKDPVKNTLAPLLEGIQIGLETGDMEWAGYNSFYYCDHLFFIGEPLEVVAQKQAQHFDSMLKLKQTLQSYYLNIWRRLVLKLQGLAEERYSFHGEMVTDAEILQGLITAKNQMFTFTAYLANTIIFYLFKDYTQAVTSASLASDYQGGVTGMLINATHNFYYSLALLAQAPSFSKSDRSQALAKVRSHQQIMHNWASHAPCNFQHKYDLVEAEKARVLGQTLKAIDYYDRAIAGAKENKYIQEEALANELAAEFYLSWGKEKIAQAYMRDAYYSYVRWGATAKVKDLEARYPKLLSNTSTASSIADTRTTTTTTQTGTSSGKALDLASVMKASQVFSSEILLDKLLEKLTKILIQNVGAQVGFLILEEAGELLIEAEGTLDGQVTVLQSMPMEFVKPDGKMPLLSSAIVNYVIRTRESVVLNDATREGQFINEGYIKQYKPKSILCAPLMYQGQLGGVVYLENNLTFGAFTPQRLEVLQLLSGQAAIAIDNAKLYKQVRESESRQRQFLDAMPVGVFVADRQGQPCYTNQVGQQILGKGVVNSPSTEQLSEIYQTYLAGTDQLYPSDRVPVVKALQGESVKLDDMEIHHPDKTIPIEASGTPIYDEEGNIPYGIVAFTDITERKQAEAERETFLNELSQLNRDLEQANQQLEEYSQTLEEKVEQRTAQLKAAQKQIIAKEKLSSLGALTAGVAHEIRNPLNFVNNYAEGSVELTEELLEEIDNQAQHLDADTLDYIKQMLIDIRDNAAAIHQHGQRAEGIISSMMQHARTDGSQHQSTDLNALLDQAVQLAYHSRRAIDISFNAMICTDYDHTIGRLGVVSSDLNRAFINLIDNACYAVFTKQKSYQQHSPGEEVYAPKLWIKTQNLGEAVEIRIRDNGMGIPAEAKEKIFHPFFTTKPTGEGTGLGLSLTHDIIVGQHGGTLKVETEPGAYTEFIISLPRA
jgi:histidine kinase